jgi:membrane protease YdiL (CAAX protease family)
MSEVPENNSLEPEGSRADPAMDSSGHPREILQAETASAIPSLTVFENPFAAGTEGQPESEPPTIDPALFYSWSQPAIRPQPRIPHLGHLALLGLLVFVALMGSGILTQVALHFHLFGISTVKQALTDIHYTLGSMAVLYLLTLCGCVLLFPLLWHKSFFAGLQWRASTAFQLRGRLFAAAFICFLLALVNGWLLPGPTNTPIDKLFRTSTGAWMMFAFGITFAPFFEEIVFRGFLLPTLCTAFDWIGEKINGEPAPQLDGNGHPQWSNLAMMVASIVTSLPFALMHAEQTSYALGPFLLLVCVSLVLCWTRLTTRSLAASVMVHACYNFLLFSLMMLGTSGFRHMDKM